MDLAIAVLVVVRSRLTLSHAPYGGAQGVTPKCREVRELAVVIAIVAGGGEKW